MSILPRIPRRELQRPGLLHTPGFIPLTDEAIKHLEMCGDAIKVGPDAIIPQHHAATFKQYLAIVNHYQRQARLFTRVGCFLRGQTDTYFGPGGYLNASPAALRPSAEGTPFFGCTDAESVMQQIGPWLQVLGDELEIDIGDCLRYSPVGPGEDYGFVRFLQPSALGGKHSSNALEAILQHYGFPTYCLDVTVSPLVAAWFALHKAHRTEKGEITYSPKLAPPADIRSKVQTSEDLASVSSVLVYLQWWDEREWPVIDLGKSDELRRVAIRPLVQKALSMPFLITNLRQPQEAIHVREHGCVRCPTAVIKLHFGADEMQRAKPEITIDSLLPLDDPLYLALLDAKVPHLAIYHSDSNLRADSGPRRESTSWPPPKRTARRSQKSKPLPGSAAENPRVDRVWLRGQQILKEAGIKVWGSSFSSHDVVFILDDPDAVPEEVRAALVRLGRWGGVEVYGQRRDSEDW